MRSVVWAAVAVLIGIADARAHDFYSRKFNRAGESCCNDRDCRPIPNSAVRIAPTGYVVKVGEIESLIPFDQTLNSPDGQFHACAWGGSVRCLFVPPLGA